MTEPTEYSEIQQLEDHIDTLASRIKELEELRLEVINLKLANQEAQKVIEQLCSDSHRGQANGPLLTLALAVVEADKELLDATDDFEREAAHSEIGEAKDALAQWLKDNEGVE